MTDVDIFARLVEGQPRSRGHSDLAGHRSVLRFLGRKWRNSERRRCDIDVALLIPIAAAAVSSSAVGSTKDVHMLDAETLKAFAGYGLPGLLAVAVLFLAYQAIRRGIRLKIEAEIPPKQAGE